MVSIVATGREQFSDDHGVFSLAGLREGPAQLRVRHLGYIPINLAVVVHGARVDTVRVAMTHIAVRLATTHVSAHPACTNPGAPDVRPDAAFVTVFDQLRQDADQFRLLSNTYPYVFAVERTLSTSFGNGDIRIDAIDTTLLASSDAWRYHPGTVVQREGVLRGLGLGTLTMHIPTLAIFGDTVFIDNHCFYDSGVESVDGKELLRIDFLAASRLSDPDVDGSIYLDPNSFHIRQSVVRLSRIPRGISGLDEIEAVTYFGEVVTSIPVITGIISENRFIVGSRRPDAEVGANEQQRLVAFRFLKGRPGGAPPKP